MDNEGIMLLVIASVKICKFGIYFQVQGDGQTTMDGLGTVGTATIIATGPGTATLVMNHPGASGGGGSRQNHPHHGVEVISDGTTSYVTVPTTNGGQAYITAEQYESLQAQMAASQQQQQQQQQQQREGTEGLHSVGDKEPEVAEQEDLQHSTGSSSRNEVYNLPPEVTPGRGYSLTTTQNPAEPGIVTSTDLNSPPQEEEEEDKESGEAEVGEDDRKDRKHVGGHVYKTPRGLLLATAAEVLKSSTS